MAKRAAKKDNKSIIIGVCVALVTIIVVVVIVILARNSANVLNDDYFKSDDTKYVLTYETDSIDVDSEGEEYIPVKTHIVFDYSGDEITGMKSYAEFADAATAEKAYQQLKDSDSEEAKNAELKGKYIVFTNDKSEYEELTASEVKERIELMEALKNMDTDSDDSIVEDVDSEETTDDEEE